MNEYREMLAAMRNEVSEAEEHDTSSADIALIKMVHLDELIDRIGEAEVNLAREQCEAEDYAEWLSGGEPS